VLEQIIKQQIQDRGTIGFDEFMHLALYHPKYGYYRSNAPKLGTSGDFITAPEISDLFGFCLAKQIAKIGGDILEFGSGSGVLATQILSYLKTINKLPNKYYILELSADFKDRQQQNILAILPELKDKVIWLDTIPDEFCGTIFANEVLDAMPTKRARIKDGCFYELGVGLENNEFIWQQMTNKMTNKKYNLIDNYTTEFNMQNLAWIKSLGQINGSFVALLIDYGYTENEFFHPQRIHGTLRCYQNHTADDNPFVDIGTKDITSWVNFSQLASQAQECGLEVLGYNTQAMFLIALGIEQFLESKEGEARVRMLSEIKQLIMPQHMGESFKLLALSKNKQIKLELFKMQNLDYKL
jgi:SAM-dependent MidA family methyltransferase